MRIIITKTGGNEVSDLVNPKNTNKKDNKPHLSNKNLELKSKEYLKTNIKFNHNDSEEKLETLRSKHTQNSGRNIQSTDNFVKTSNNLNNTKETFSQSKYKNVISHKSVNLQLKKLAVSKNDNDKYNHDETKKNIIGSDLPEEINNREVASLKISEILNRKAYEKLKNKFDFDETVKGNLHKLDEKHFRSVFEPSNVDKFNAQLNKDIDREKVNLIKYLHSKQEISQKLIEKLNKFDEAKLTKINRICKIYFHYEHNDKKQKEKVKEKMKEIDESRRAKPKVLKNQIESNLKQFDEILADYPTLDKQLYKKVFRDKHSEFESKYWANLEDKTYIKPLNTENKINSKVLGKMKTTQNGTSSKTLPNIVGNKSK